ncbi:MAG: hypothetical protein A2032_01305 [Chloroflexi bacterium RBG_19FT_COMBO_49_13]|nr:MAG: hypothetical protein A2032_01305 [Chloroflexi bacterium RBG_19FT_COMBO_49_13]
MFYSPQIRKLTTFESLLLESTMFEILIDLGKVKISTYTYESQRERILNGFAESEYLVNKKAPKFVFLHIIAPHPPFVFDKNGNPVQPDWEYNIFDGRQFFGGLEEYKEGYIKQMMYVNSLILKTIDQIMKYSSSPPIIVLQADHGSGALLGSSIETSCLKERFSILNAYYFPDGNTSRLYSSISPVNTFRVIFDTYFRTNLALLPDLYYFSDHDDPYQYDAVTDQVDTPCHLSELP